MAVLPIIEAPHPLLNTKSELVEKIDSEAKKNMDDMLDSMRHVGDGVGLAAVQIGVLKRIFVLDIRLDGTMPENDDESNPIFFVNPVITNKSTETFIHKEGCLSFPDVYVDVERHEWVEVEFLNYHGEKQSLKAHEWLAIGIQHEYDHIEGITFADRISKLKKDILMKKLAKNRKRYVD